MTRNELLNAIAAAEVKLDALKQEVADKESEEGVAYRALTEDVHRLCCTSNHTDICGWHWETGEDKWSRSTHKTWLLRVKEWTKKWPGFSHNQLLTSLHIAESL